MRTSALHRSCPALTVWSPTNAHPARLAVALEPLRPLDPEVVLVVDDRVPAGWDRGYRRLADRVVRVPFPGYYGRMYPWVRTLCRGSWILHLDADEVPSQALAAEIASTLRDCALTHAWVPRRWLFGSVERHLAEWPWLPDYGLRLFRNDPAVLRFPGLMHEPLAAIGPRRYLDGALLHLDLLLSSFETRIAKCKRLERARPGLKLDGLPFNEAFYLPEVRSPRTAPLPSADSDAAARFLAATTAEPRLQRRPRSRWGRRRPAVEQVGSAETTAAWERRELADNAYAARITACDSDLEAVAGSQRTFDVVVANLGSEVWPGGMEAHPQIRLAYRIGEEDGLRTPLGAPVPPGGRCRVPLEVRIPPRPGALRLQVDLVHEHRRWFGCPTELVIQVRAPRVADRG
jgi:hypothetical protein